MTTDGQQLHDRSTRGELLTTAEQKELTEWYHMQDANEIQLLQHLSLHADISTLHHQLEIALLQIERLSHDIQLLLRTNAELRQDIRHLQSQLYSESARHAA